jgi:hypothetical protein
VDPLTSKYPHYTPYSFSGNKVVAFIELEGLEEIYHFTAQERKNNNFKAALALIQDSGIMEELKTSFALNNKKTDIYINLTTFGDNSPKLGTTSILEHKEKVLKRKKFKEFDKKEQAILDKSALGNKVIEVTGVREYEDILKKAMFVVDNTYLKGQTPIIVNIREDLEIRRMAATIIHEIFVHALNNKTGVDLVTQDKEHKDYFNDPDFYKKYPSGDDSPEYEDFKPNSKAGKYKDRIEKAYKKKYESK